jgi:hypothetical protein
MTGELRAHAGVPERFLRPPRASPSGAYDWPDERCWPARAARGACPDLDQAARAADAVGDGVAAAPGGSSRRWAGAQARAALRSRGVG